MDLADYESSPNVDPLMKEIDAYGLYKHVVELEAYGMTVVPPETIGASPEFAERLRNAIITTCEKRNNIKIGDFRDSNAAPEMTSKNSWLLMEEDEVFVEAATNPQMMALVRWLCGQSATLTGHTWIMKPEGGDGIALHSDQHGIPPGGGHIAHAANASWLCTDYHGEEDGPTVFVPGSHRFGRATLPHETDLKTTPFKWMPLIGKAGSLAIWHGGTWHASVPRTNPGLRVTLVQVYMRRHMRPIHLWEDQISDNMIEKFPDLKRVLGIDHMYPMGMEGDDKGRSARMMETGTDPFA